MFFLPPFYNYIIVHVPYDVNAFTSFFKFFYAIIKIMSYLKKFDNFPDFDYFSRNYRQFESDFHELSALKVPLTFFTDDIRATMRATGDTFFILDSANCKEMVKIRFDFELNDDIYTYKGFIRFNGKYE